MTGSPRPLCDCPEPCACYAEGYAAGKDKAYFEVIASLDGPAPRRGLRLPALPGQAGLPEEGDDPDGREFAGAVRVGGGPGPWTTMTTQTAQKLILTRPERMTRRHRALA